MRVLFNQGTPVPLRRELSDHEVVTAFERGWSELSNGELLVAAETAGLEVLVITDQNLPHHQNLAVFHLGVVVLETTSWPRIQRRIDKVRDAIRAVRPGRVVRVSFPE